MVIVGKEITMGDNPEVSDIDEEYGVEIESTGDEIEVDPEDAAWQLEGEYQPQDGE